MPARYMLIIIVSIHEIASMRRIVSESMKASYEITRASYAITAAVLLSLLFPAAASGQGMLLYAYDFEDSLNISLEQIGMNTTGWPTGLDFPGEWVEYVLHPGSSAPTR
jgi:hypothetical protein